MYKLTKTVNLVLGGGGIKGIAYAGAFSLMEKEGIRWGNIAGVSAGALVGAYVSAGYSAEELSCMLDSFNFSKITLDKIYKRVPAIQQYMAFALKYRGQVSTTSDTVKIFLNSPLINAARDSDGCKLDLLGYRGNLLKNIITLCKQGCLCDGDYLEEWVYKSLLQKGVRTFADLRGGKVDDKNPGGYKIRMTAVDADRAKVIVLPDDIDFYGVNPDKLEVSRAVRMSTCVPFAFKPVELKKDGDKGSRNYHILDGGVLDGLPSWLMDTTTASDTIGFRLKGNDKNKLLSIDTPLNVLKALISSIHDTGVDKKAPKLKYIGDIDTGDISFLDFNLSEQEKQYLYDSGRETAVKLISDYKANWLNKGRKIFDFLPSIKGKD